MKLIISKDDLDRRVNWDKVGICFVKRQGHKIRPVKKLNDVVIGLFNLGVKT